MKDNFTSLIPIEKITSRIYLIRKEKVLLDLDLAVLYGVETAQLKRAVRRNSIRFPNDFMFQLTRREYENLRCHFDTSSWGGRRYLPFAFTEQGVAMLSSVLRSERAVLVNIAIMRAFVSMRKYLYSNAALTGKLKELERKTKNKFAEHEKQIEVIFETIKQLIMENDRPKRKIGF